MLVSKRLYVVFHKALGPLLFLIYVNDLKHASESLDCIMFTDNTNFSYSLKSIKGLFYTVNSELEKIINTIKTTCFNDWH